MLRHTLRALRRALPLFLVVATVALCAPASAQDLPAVNVQLFRPAPGPADYLNLYGTGLTPHLKWHAGLFLNYADAPLRERGEGSIETEVLDFQVGADAYGTIGLWDVLELGIAVPVTVLQATDSLDPVALGRGNDLRPAAFGDIRLSLKAEVLSLLEGFGLGVVGVFYAPSGDADAFGGDGHVGADGRILAEYLAPFGIRLASNLGYRYRVNGRRVRAAFIGNEVIWGVGTVIPLFAEKLDALAEIDGGIPLSPGSNGEVEDPAKATPAEAKIALRYALNEDWTLTGGLGRRLSDAYGAPDSRVFVSIGGQWVTGGKWNWDYDRDGFLGAADKCPRENEDLDGFEDEDGCPDPDNDGDGIRDVLDRCPDSGGPDVGEDGCPDDDPDGDHIRGDKDKCPEDPEDFDRFEDSDGCPDTDNDKDGIPDVQDSCPDTAETVNGIVDDDGCPEVEGQKVIVTRNKIEILEKVYFDSGKDTIKARSFAVLDEVGDVLKRNRNIRRIRIEGHTDDRGGEAYNLRLSQRRAAAVRTYLIENARVQEDRLVSVGYGESKPIVENDTGENRSRNRRVEFIIALDDKPGSVLPADEGDPLDSLGLE